MLQKSELNNSKSFSQFLHLVNTCVVEFYGFLFFHIIYHHHQTISCVFSSSPRFSLTEKPDNYLLQETLDFSTVITRESFSSLIMKDSYVDLKVFSYYTDDGLQVYQGGLSRFARHGRITNNSSGGEVKDTWIVDIDNEIKI